MRSRLIVVAAALFALAPLGTAAAQHPQTRDGFWFNVGLGFGSLGCENCGDRVNGLTGQLSLGGTVSDHLYLGVGTNGWTKSEDGVTLSVGTLTALVRVYPSATGGFFLTGGLGLGSVDLDVSGLGSDSETGVGVLIGLGYDIRVGSNVSLTPFWNGYAVNHDSGDANVGQLGLSVTLH